MNELLDRMLLGGLKDLSGLEIEGVIPIRQEVLNEALRETLQSGVPQPSGKAPKPPEGLDINALLAHVKNVGVTADDGKLTLSFSIKID